MVVANGVAEAGLRERSALVDGLVNAAYDSAQPPVTVVAVGGYGRTELFPHSDVDLLLLTSSPHPSQEARDAISVFLQTLWDGGLRVSQSVRTVGECCEIHEGNLELTISLLDHRFLCGPRAPYDALLAAFPKFLNGERNNIVDHLCRMTRTRHAKYGDTIYHLEPNVKEHPGGLRDLHVIHWLNKLKPAMPDPLSAAREFLFSVRVFLHEQSGRDNNMLSFDAQEQIAAEPDAWMRKYYRHARDIFRAVARSMEVREGSNRGLLGHFRDWRGRVSNAEFTVVNERILLREPGKIDSDPNVVVRLVEFVARHNLRLARDTEQRIAAALPDLRRRVTWRWDNLREIFRQVDCATGLRAMQDTGLLEECIPSWRLIDCLVKRDFYHRYTVDEHTLVALHAIGDLSRSAEPHHRRLQGLLNEAAQPELLRFALLLHDIGKGADRGGNHSAESVRIANGEMERLQFPAREREIAVFLIEHHLDLSSVMTSRDLEDRATAKYLSTRVGTVERLKLLTLMTYADISAVNPTAMTPWRLEQLWRVYVLAHEELTSELDTQRIHAAATAEEGEFLEGFPIRYIRTHTPVDVAAHFALAQSSRSAGVGVEITRDRGVYRMTVITSDRPFLFASISGALASFGLNILKAEAFSNAQRLALDTFAFADPNRTLELNPPEMDRLRTTIIRAVLGKVDVKQLLRHRKKPQAVSRGAQITATAGFNNRASERATLIEIVAEDRPGLLYDLASTISSAGLNIEVVLIDTEAHKALDVFYVTWQGAKIPDEMTGSLKTSLIQACQQ
jgi:[protein-PII] uridylyltransferase